jgi:DNA invertase Pin-like site-specific DNA recombinase
MIARRIARSPTKQAGPQVRTGSADPVFEHGSASPPLKGTRANADLDGNEGRSPLSVAAPQGDTPDTKHLVAVPYLRVSTDDKGQDPQRQLIVIEPWAQREGVALLDAEIDEGTSASKTNPFERPRFVVACERAMAAGADAIVVECSDRFSRQGSKLDAWAEIEVERRYRLRVLRADKTLVAHDTMVGNVGDAIHAEGARSWVQEHSKKVRSGMAKAKRDGAHVGRPPKILTPAEVAMVEKLRSEGKGWRLCALAVSRGRGAFELADPAARLSRAVSHTHVRRVLEARQAVTKLGVEQKA